MASTSPLETPLVNEASGESLGRAIWWRRPAMKISMVIATVMVIGFAGFFLLAPPSTHKVPFKPLKEKPGSVEEVLKMSPKLMSLQDANEFFAGLPPHNQEDMVFEHIIPQSKRLFEQ